MDAKIKALIGIGASVNANCRPCLQHHAQEALLQGATPEEIGEAFKIGKAVRDSQTEKMDELGAKLAGEAPAEKPAACIGKSCC